ncbi:MAG: hypothetical protein AB2L24_01720 [Mangrovibacterium sp.]
MNLLTNQQACLRLTKQFLVRIPFFLLFIFNSAILSGQENNKVLPPAYIVPNFHPASCRWLTNWSTERNYCSNSYLNHLDRVGDDANYRFVLSECNNLIAI